MARRPARSSSAAPFSDHFTTVGSTLYFTVRDGRGEALWKTDGTAAGTVEIQVFGDGTYNYASHYPSGLTNVGGRLFFAAGDLQFGNELRVVDESVAARSQRSPAQVMEASGEESKGDARLSAARLKQTVAHQAQPLASLAALTTALPKK